MKLTKESTFKWHTFREFHGKIFCMESSNAKNDYLCFIKHKLGNGAEAVAVCPILLHLSELRSNLYTTKVFNWLVLVRLNLALSQKAFLMKNIQNSTLMVTGGKQARRDFKRLLLKTAT